MNKQNIIHQQLDLLARNVDELQLGLTHASIQILSPDVAAKAELIRKDVDTLSLQMSEYETGYAQLRGLEAIGQAVNSSLDLHGVLMSVMDTIIKLTGAERGFLLLRDNKGQFVPRIARNWEKDTVSEAESHISRSVIKRVLDEGQPVMTTNAQEDPRFVSKQSVIANSLRSILCVPLKVKETLVGVIYTDHRIQTGLFNDTDRVTLMAFANQAAIALENARLYDSMQHSLAEATGLKNLMESVFSSITSSIITTDENKKVLFCNPAAQQLFGIQTGQILDVFLRKSFPELGDKLGPYMDLAQHRQEAMEGIELNPHNKDRRQMDLRVALSPLRDMREHKMRGLTVVIEDFSEKKRLQAQHRLFEKMVSPAVIQQLDPDTLQLGGSRTLLTVLFADIGGFTSLGETVSPETLVSVVNCYLSAAAEAVLDHGGTIDKFLGDAVMAWFNAPVPQADHALLAIKTAWAIREALPEIHCRLPEAFQLDFSIGIHTGEAVLGMIGSEKRMEYTAIGDSVNIAKRLQEQAGSSQIIISAQTHELVKHAVMVKRLDPLLLRGRRETLEVYEVLGFV